MAADGQESGLDKRLAFFEKDPIQWKTYQYNKAGGLLSQSAAAA